MSIGSNLSLLDTNQNSQVLSRHGKELSLRAIDLLPVGKATLFGWLYFFYFNQSPWVVPVEMPIDVLLFDLAIILVTNIL